MKHITELEHVDLSGRTCIVRVDYNVPVVDGIVVDDFRIRSSFETIMYLKNKGAHIILMSHIENKEHPSLLAVSNHINQQFINGAYPFATFFCNDLPQAFIKNDLYISGEDLHMQLKDIQEDLEKHQILLFENLRTVPGEKKNDQKFIDILAQLGDVYVNEAFSVSHREHASVVGLPQVIHNHYAGFGLIQEIEKLEQGLHPTHPFIFILGGAKFETKLPLIEKFINSADKVIIGGALYNDILKAKGFGIGASLVSSSEVHLDAVVHNPKLLIPQNVIVKNALGTISTVNIDQVAPTDMIVDIGPDLIVQLRTYLESLPSDTNVKPCILWNGPMGLYEQGYTEQTIAIAQLISEKQITTLVGGGDTAAAIASLGEVHPSIYISTGGGAMIEYMLHETLPGIEVLA